MTIVISKKILLVAAAILLVVVTAATTMLLTTGSGSTVSKYHAATHSKINHSKGCTYANYFCHSVGK